MLLDLSDLSDLFIDIFIQFVIHCLISRGGGGGGILLNIGGKNKTHNKIKLCTGTQSYKKLPQSGGLGNGPQGKFS